MRTVRTPVSRLAQYLNGRAFQPEDFTDEGLTILRIRDLLNPDAPPDRFDGLVSSQNLVQYGDLVFAWSATLAVRFWRKEDAVLNQHLFKVVPTDGVSKSYLRWALEHAIVDLSGHMHGSAMSHITREMLKDVFVELPSEIHQNIVARYLDRETEQIDALIGKQEQMVKVLTERRRAVITQAITRGLDPTKELKNSGSTWFGSVPIAWPMIKCGLICHLIQTGPFGSQLHAEEYVDDGVPLLNPMHYVDGLVAPSLKMTVSDEKAADLNRHRLELNDVIVARRGALGRCAVISPAAVGYLCGTGSAIVRLRTDRVDAHYFQLIFSSRNVQDALLQFSVGSTMDNLNTSTIANLRIPCPEIGEQRRIVSFIAEQTKRIDMLINKALQVIEVLKERRQALISAAVTGKIDVRGL